MRRPTLALTAAAVLAAATCVSFGQTSVSASGSLDPHSTPEWALVAPHLPDPITGKADQLETAGDVLRARRFPSDAITFYKAAALRGGDPGRLLMKEGVVYLELQQHLLARLCFQRAVKLRKSDAEAWNNLGAADFTLNQIGSAISEYKKAIKLKKNSAVFHSNLALAYFDAKDTSSARKELDKALRLDPNLLSHTDQSGYNLQILASTNYAQICFETARAYAAQADAENTLLWLTRAAERGFDVREAMQRDSMLQPLLRDPRVKIMLGNADQLRNRNLNAKAKAPSLGNSAEEKP